MNVDMSIRLFAGTQLLNYITKSFNHLPLFVLNYMKKCCQDQFQEKEEEKEVNKIVSFIITLIIRYGQVHNWIDMISFLIDNLKNNTHLYLETLLMICRDVAPELDQPEFGIQPLKSLLPQLVEFYSHKDNSIKLQALQATSQFILLKSPTLVNHLDLILKSLYNITIHDKEISIRQEFCKMMTLLLEAFPTQMIPYLDSTMLNYMIQALNDTDDEVKMSSCTFWAQYADHSRQLFKPEHIPHLPHLMKYLLSLMTYSESDIHCLYHQQTTLTTIINDKKQHCPIIIGSDLEEEDDDDLSDDEEFYSDDSLRKRSAQTLEVLSMALGSYITPAILDHVNQNRHQDWLVRESGILALGAAAEGKVT